MSASGFQIPAGALDRPDEPHQARDPAHELLCVCTDCNQTVLVCGYVDDLDPDTYRCLDCRPFKDDPDPRALVLAQVLEAQRSGDDIPYRTEV